MDIFGAKPGVDHKGKGEGPDPAPLDPDPEDFKSRLKRIVGSIPKTDWKPSLPEVSRRRLLGLLLAVLLAWGAWAFLRGSFRSVPPGHLGVAVSRFTGSLETLPPGTHFRPRSLYDVHAVRVSDQLTSGPEGTFSVSTKEGVVAQMTVQARWSVDRRRLASTWASLPENPEHDLVAPVLAAAFRASATRYDVARLIADGREEIAEQAGRTARSRLAESGVDLKEVLVANVVLPAEYERGRVALVDEVQSTDRMAVTLRLKEKEVEKVKLEAEAQKALVVKQAEAAASQRLIAARAEADAMKYVLSLKEKEIEQKKLEAQGERQSRVERAKAEAEVTRIAAEAEVARRKVIADAEAYSIRATSLAQFEGLEREARLVSSNPLLIPKTFADRLSDKVQVILTPTIGGEAFTGEVLKRVANGAPPVASKAEAALRAAARRTKAPVPDPAPADEEENEQQ
jgi:regulator of protease activity HflC (stomatin/prohibitin superfamily)